MKQIYFFCLSTLLSFSARDTFAMHLTNSSDSVLSKARKLQELYTKSTGFANNEIYQMQFFDQFPSSFSEFNIFYGYENDTPSVLFNEAERHISCLFNNMNAINDTLYFRKIVRISIGGHWSADAVSYFQNQLRGRVVNNVELTAYILENLPESKIRSFWFFYFDEPHPEKQIPNELQKIKEVDCKIYNLMLQAHKKVIKEWADE